MRKYRVYYYAERFDECQDFNIEIQGENISKALENFYKLNIVIKRVYKIDEI